MPEQLVTCPKCKSQFRLPPNVIVVGCPACGERIRIQTPTFQRATP